MMQLKYDLLPSEYEQEMKQTEWNTVDRKIRDSLAAAEEPLIAKAIGSIREEIRPRGWATGDAFLKRMGTGWNRNHSPDCPARLGWGWVVVRTYSRRQAIEIRAKYD